MRICLLTYDTPHKKTEHVFWGLHNQGVRNIGFLLMPFVSRAKRQVLLQHRPTQFEGVKPQSLAAFSGGDIFRYSSWHETIDQYDFFLICGSNLIEPDFANTGKVINSHAGLIPISRGLDSFKWSISENRRMGCTLHTINAQADSGTLLAHLDTPLFECDDLVSYAERHYLNEICMLINFKTMIARGDIFEDLGPANPPRKRMSQLVEKEMINSFNNYKSRFAV